MSHSITVTGSEPAQDGHFKVDASVKDVRASGHLSNQIKVQQPTTPSPAMGPPSASSIKTTEGVATVHQHINGTSLVTLPSGLQMTWDEAISAGLVERPEDPKSAVGSNPATPSGTPPALDAEQAKHTIDKAELKQHASELNEIGEALVGSGVDPEGALDRIAERVPQVLFGSGGADVPEDIEDALIQRYGPEEAQTVLSNLMYHAASLTQDAVRAASLPRDQATTDALGAHLRKTPGVYASALRGKPQALNDAVFQFARYRPNR